MNAMQFKSIWTREERAAFAGWDFSRLDGRWESDPLPWNYARIVRENLRAMDELLDIGTGGGEFLLSLGHPHARTSVTEEYPPNVALCRQKLVPLGISLGVPQDDKLPFGDARFDLVIDRHEAYDPAEVFRVLRPGGRFITQQVGGENNRELSQRLIDGFTPAFEHVTLEAGVAGLEESGFCVLRAQEARPALRFFDVGALVYFAKIIEWEFPGFSVETAFDRLLGCQREIEERGFVGSTEHRLLIAAQKP